MGELDLVLLLARGLASWISIVRYEPSCVWLVGSYAIRYCERISSWICRNAWRSSRSSRGKYARPPVRSESFLRVALIDAAVKIVADADRVNDRLGLQRGLDGIVEFLLAECVVRRRSAE